MKASTSFDTQEASSLHALDGRAGRAETTDQERRWEVWVQHTSGTWNLCESFEVKDRAESYVAHYVEKHGPKWKRILAVVEAVAVARTEMVVTRTVRSPIE